VKVANDFPLKQVQSRDKVVVPFRL